MLATTVPRHLLPARAEVLGIFVAGIGPSGRNGRRVERRSL
jgi:hypothetical protein